MDRDVIIREVKVDGIWVSLEAYRKLKKVEIKEALFCIGLVILIGAGLITFLWAL